MMRQLTRSQGEALTALLHTLRKDWDLAGIRAALRKAGELGPAVDVAVAACRVAANPDARTPALIHEPGTHWQELATGQRLVPVMCQEHDQPAGRCSECDALAAPMPDEIRELARQARRTTPKPKPKSNTHQSDPERIAQLRAQLTGGDE